MLHGYRKRKLDFMKRFGGKARIMQDKKYKRKIKHKKVNYELTR